MATEEFFGAPEEQSIIKSLIVTKYFWSWATIMMSVLKYDKRVAYVDFFSGPGEYEDGTPSTPMLLLNEAIKIKALRDNLIMVFNDQNTDYAENLQRLISEYPDIETFAYQPDVLNLEVGESLTSIPDEVSSLPGLFFIDPWGYKGLSLDLIGASIAGWGCDCILFFNYNRINPGINNPYVEGLMREIFGDARFEHLREQLVSIADADDRKTIILEEYVRALKDVGAKYVLAFEFESDDSERTSHYIIFASKHFRGYAIMKDVMYGLSTDDGEVRRLEFVPVRTGQMGLGLELFDPDNPYSIDILKRVLLRDCAGQTLTVEDIFEQHSPDTPYVLKHFQKALIELELAGLVSVDVPVDKRRKYKGEMTLGKQRIVTFPA